MDTMKYVIYARKSSEEKTKQIQSIESQITEMQRIAERENLSIVKIFREEKSAKKPGRPVFGEMIEFFDLILFATKDPNNFVTFNRFSRNMRYIAHRML